MSIIKFSFLQEKRFDIFYCTKKIYRAVMVRKVPCTCESHFAVPFQIVISRIKMPNAFGRAIIRMERSRIPFAARVLRSGDVYPRIFKKRASLCDGQAVSERFVLFADHIDSRARVPA